MTAVLVVEDEADIATVIRLYLERAGYETRVSASISEAREALATGLVDLAILDVMLPDGDGFELCRDIRQAGTLPVMMVTARSDDVDRIRGLEIGADDYLPKPFNPRELVARVNALARRIGLRPGCEVTIDASGRTAWVRGRGVALTPTEFELLSLLSRHPGRVLSRGELLDLVWGQDYVGDPKVVDVNVRRLREKVEVDPSNPRLIRTVWGVGYSYHSGAGGGSDHP